MTHILENKIKREQIVVIGVPCQGMIDKRKVAALVQGDILDVTEEDGTVKVKPASGTETNRLTYLGQETITTPAGQYDCVKVRVYNGWSENDGSNGTEDLVLWIDPDIGIIQEQCSRYDYDAWDGYGESRRLLCAHGCI